MTHIIEPDSKTYRSYVSRVMAKEPSGALAGNDAKLAYVATPPPPEPAPTGYLA